MPEPRVEQSQQPGAEIGPISLLEQIRYPSKVIEPQWQLTNVLLTGGEVRSGFVIARTGTELSMKIAGGETIKIPVNQ